MIVMYEPMAFTGQAPAGTGRVVLKVVQVTDVVLSGSLTIRPIANFCVPLSSHTQNLYTILKGGLDAFRFSFKQAVDYSKKNLNAPRPSEHPPVRGENVKTFRWDHRLQIIQNIFIDIGSTI